ncbi:YdeI/OmpD-associated family protein [Terriglobus sp.]|uniref:YdeI/OmpD-associated family protein n=1 Tax=Terriglobus sp. TaxID=1889013 RepID=UPI003B00DED6
MATARLKTPTMPVHTRDARIDAKIAAANPALQPVLLYLRELVHEAVPEVTETVKWGHPFFELNGTILANMGAFKHHCAFGFWSKTMTEHLAADGFTPGEGAGSLGKLTTLESLPPRKKLLGYIRTAASHIRNGTSESSMQTRAAKKRGPDGAASSKPPMAMPVIFAEALANEPRAKQTFEAFPASCRGEYLAWITEAKRDETRARRVQQAVLQLAEGKRFNWQYEAKG